MMCVAGGGLFGPVSKPSLSCADNEAFRNLTLFKPFLSSTLFLFPLFTAHFSSSSLPLTSSPSFTSPPPSITALSASSCCRRNRSSCSDVCFLTSSSFLLVDSSTESKNSTSSSSRFRNWFLSRMDSSKASCLAADGIRGNLTCQSSSLRAAGRWPGQAVV